MRHPVVRHRVIFISAVAGLLAFGFIQIQAQQKQDRPKDEASEKTRDQTPDAKPTLPHPVLDVQGLMRTFNGPVYKRLHATMQQPPASDKQWNDIQYDALQIAEIANLIAIRKVPDKIVPTVMQHATELQKAGIALDEAAHSHNEQATQQSYRHVIETCNACHKALAPDKAPEVKP